MLTLVTISGAVVGTLERSYGLDHVVKSGGQYIVCERTPFILDKELGVREIREWSLGERISDVGYLVLWNASLFEAQLTKLKKTP